MKKIISIACAVFFYSFCALAQKSETITVHGSELSFFIAKDGYKYNEFKRAKVYFNNGDSAGGNLNYNYLLQSMQFVDQKGDTLIVKDQNTINHITVGVDTFYYDDGFIEWVASSATARIGVRKVFKTSDVQKLGAFGLPNPTGSISSLNETGGYNSRRIEPNEVIVFTKQTTYYISSPNGKFVEANKKSISKLFPKKDIDDYISQNKLNLSKEEDLIDLFVYASRSK